MLDANTDHAAAALPQSEPTEDQGRPDKVEDTRGKIYRAISLVRLSQQRLQVFAGNTGEECDPYVAGDLGEALGIALDLLDEAADDFEDFTERPALVTSGVPS